MFPFDATNGVINPTIGDDNITAGEGPHEFLYDFDSNVGGEDTLSDSGTDSDDRIFFKNIPDNHTILVSRDTDNNSGFRIETFDTFNLSQLVLIIQSIQLKLHIQQIM